MRSHPGTGAALRASVAALALVAAVQGAAAQEAARVRAGEHPAYTRLVIDAAPGQGFSWGIDGERLLILLDAPALDTAPASRMRGLSRVGAIDAVESTGGSALSVALRCVCGARVQRLADGRIVIDVAEGAPRPAVPAALAAALGEAATAAPAPQPAPAPSVPDAATPATAAAEIPRPPVPTPRPTPPSPPATVAAAPAPAPHEAAPHGAAPAAPAPESHSPAPPAPAAPEPAAPPAPHAEAAPAPQGTDPAPPDPHPPAATAHAEAPQPPHGATGHDGAAQSPADETAATVEAARRALLRQLERAAEQGYLTLAKPIELPPDEAPEAPEPEHGDTAEHAAPHDAAEAEPPAIPENLPIRARAGNELASQRPPRGAEGQEALPAHCLDDDDFAVSQWVADAPLDLQIGQRRRSLVGEFDQASAGAVLAYVRLLIASGFGLEAQGALQAFAEELPPTPYLYDLARLVDGEGVGPETPVGAGLDCRGAHLVWAVAGAAMEGRLDPETLDVAALRETLAAMPPRLRTRLIVPMATVALEAGRIEDAEVLAGMAARAEPPPPDGDGMLLVVLARIDAERGDWRRAEATLSPLLEQTSPAGIEAMIRMVEFRVARRVAPPRGMADNMEALAFTLGASDLGRRLLRAAASARAAGEGLGLALGALRTLAERGGDEGSAMAAARDMLVDYTPDPAEGAAYAEAVLDHESLLGDGPDADRARVSVARNFMAIGLDNLAETILAPALARNVAAARLTAAEGATAAGDALRAVELLDGLGGERAARLRAAALFSIGDALGASAAAAETGDAALAARYAWLAGNWAAAAAAGNVDHRILAAWMAGGGEMPPELREAAATDPALAARMEAFTPDTGQDSMSLLEAAGAALEQSKRRRAVMGEILGDG